MENQAVEPKDNARLKKGETLKVRIESLAPTGEGVSKDHGVPVFVSRVAKGDLLEVKLFDVRKDFAFAQVVSILEPSPSRAEPPCKLFKVCGGCQWQHLSYEAQLEAKTEIVKQAIKHIGKGLAPDLVLPTIAAKDNLFYRNKVQFPVDTVQSTGRVRAGYYKEGSHELVNIKHCPVQPEPLDRALDSCKQAVEKEQLSTYDESKHEGLLRHIAMRYSFAANQILVTLVINSRDHKDRDLNKKLSAIASFVMQGVEEVSGVCVNYNSARGNRIMGDTNELLRGKDHVIETLKSHVEFAPDKLKNGIDYQLSGTSFFQVNSKQAEVLLDEMLLAVVGSPQKGEALRKIPLIIDAYSGVGTMSIYLSCVADKVIAIEQWKPALADAATNLSLNGITNVELVEGKVEDEAPRLVSEDVRPDVVVVDPPRKGLDQAALGAIVALKPDRIVYCSCNPATLARDLRILEDSGYKTKRIQPVDMFPQTYHVESITVLDRQ